ncbi:methionine ABC transporter permease [Aedoeadaptatus coxii]|uniref:methionine ABC transporter permease n=1 Tax=Aedoeadaptatus coxii TaxID=755172 RepID=UPI002AD45288|nr:methionine ABC transporter permease [Peptoniphilus coxii]
MRYDYEVFFKTIFMPSFVDTIFMVSISSLLSIVIALFISIGIYLTNENGLLPNRYLNTGINALVNVIRSFPFLILMVSIIPLTRFLVGTSIGRVAALVPITIVGSCFCTRLFETSFLSVDHETIEAALSMGASNLQIIRKVIIRESMPSLIQSITTCIIAVLSTSSAAGAIGAGGLGAIAIMYGYQNFDEIIMYGTVVILIIMVQLIQFIGTRLSKR